MQVKKQQLALYREQWTGSKLGKEFVKGIYCHPDYLFNLDAKYVMWIAGLDESQYGIKTAGRNINTSDMQTTPPLWQKAKRN